jgi:hypothetical protein
MVAAIARALIDFRAERSRNAMVSPVPPQLGLPSLLYFRPSEGHPLHADADHLPLGSAFQFIDGLKDTPKPFTQAAGPAAAASLAVLGLDEPELDIAAMATARHFSVRAASVYSGTSETQRNLIAGQLLK